LGTNRYYTIWLACGSLRATPIAGQFRTIENYISKRKYIYYKSIRLLIPGYAVRVSQFLKPYLSFI